jgi:hypothetical protein
LQTRTAKKRLTPLFDFGLTHAPIQAEGLDWKNTIVGKYRGKAATSFNGGFGASGALPRVEKFLWKRKNNTFAGKFVGNPACKPSPRALGASVGQCGGKWLRNQTVTSKQPDILYN